MSSSKWVSVTINYLEPDCDFIKPSLTQQMAQVKSLGQKVMRHTCGAVRDLTTDVINLGVDILNSILVPAAHMISDGPEYDSVDALCFRDDVQAALSSGPPCQVRIEEERLLNPLGPGGGCTDFSRQTSGLHRCLTDEAGVAIFYIPTFEPYRTHISVHDGITLVEDWFIEKVIIFYINGNHFIQGRLRRSLASELQWPVLRPQEEV